MECNELLALLTLWAVAPYFTEAVVRWIGAHTLGTRPASARLRCASRTTQAD